MRLFNKPTQVLFSILLMLLTFQESLMAQRLLRYQGPYQLKNYSGEAKFDYKLVKKDTVFNGPFKFQQDQLKLALGETSGHFSVKGSMQANVPEAEWQFAFGNFATEKEIEKIGYTYRLKLNGEEQNAQGKFAKGSPDGEWVQVVKKIEGAVITDTLFYSQFEFDEGVPQRSFEMNNGNGLLAGRFLEDGLAHDDWELYTLKSLEAAEIWSFSNGRLTQIAKPDNPTASKLSIYPNKLNNPEWVKLDSAYLNIIEFLILLSKNDTTDYRSGLSDLLAENEGYYQKINQLLNNLGQANFTPNIKVKVEQYSLTEEETAKLDSLSGVYSAVKTAITDLNKNTQINILKLANEEVLFETTALNYYEEEYLAPLGKIISAYNKGLLNYVPRENIASKLLPLNQLYSVEQVSYELNDTIVTRALNELLTTNKKEANDFALFFNYADQVINNIKKLQSLLNQRLEKQERQQILMQLEEALMQTVNGLNQKLDSLKSSSEAREQKVLTAAKINIKKTLSEYSRMEEDFEKPAKAKLLTECFSKTADFAMNIAQIPVYEREISKLYTDDVFNPFTSTVMSEQVKKKLTNAYKEVLIPFFLKKLEEPLSCESIAQYDRALSTLHQKMKDLRNTDTDKLERKIKNQDTAKEMLATLGIDVPGQSITP